MAERENEIGRCRCPVCSSTRARLRISAKQLAYVTCDACNAQVFARSDRSDSALRALHVAEPADVEPAAVEPAPAVKQQPAPAVMPAPTQAATPQRMGWGILG